MMSLNFLPVNLFFIFLTIISLPVSADAKGEIKSGIKNQQEAYQLIYTEREPGVDDYETSMLVSDRYIRIDEPGEKTGFIIYDDKQKTVYSISHFDKSVLVIHEHVFSEDNSPVKSTVEYLLLADAPMVSGSNIYNYRVFSGEGKNEQTCVEIQLVENLLPDVTMILGNYQKVVSGQQVKMVDNKVTQMQTACYYIDQIYNSGAYYDKGLPIQEWHSNESFKVLTSYKKIKVNSNIFEVPEDYHQFSIDKNSRIELQR